MGVYLDFGNAIEDNTRQATEAFFAKWPMFAMTTDYTGSWITPLILAIAGAADKVVEYLLARPDIKPALYQTSEHASTCLKIAVDKLSFKDTQSNRELSQRCWCIVELCLKADAQFRADSYFRVDYPIALKDIKNDIDESAVDVAQSCKGLLHHHFFILVSRYFPEDKQARCYFTSPEAREFLRSNTNTETAPGPTNNARSATTQATESTGSRLYSTLTSLFGVFSSTQPAPTNGDYQRLPTQSSSSLPLRTALSEPSSGHKPKME